MGRAARLLLVLVVVAIAPGCDRPVRRPNVVLFMTDTLRADALGCYGASHVETPRIDAFAASGTTFVNAFAQSSWTRASIASVLTGTYPATHAAEGRHDVVADLPTLPALLREAGYRTGALVTNPNIDPHFGFGDGFDDYQTLYRWAGGHWVLSKDLITRADAVVDAALDWIGTPSPDAPFFLFVLVVDPHNPYTPPPPWDTRYDPSYQGRYDGAVKTTNAMVKTMAPRDKVHMRALYDGLVSYVDGEFGRLLDGLAERRVLDHTAVIFTSDHGEAFFEHGVWGHGTSLHEEQIRVPLLVRGPGTAPGHVTDMVVETRDLYATVLAWAGVTPPTPTGARDLTPCLVAGCGSDDVAIATLDLDRRAAAMVRGPRFKLIEYPARRGKQGRRIVLHDLELDPAEQIDFSRERPEVVRNYRQRLTSARAGAEELAVVLRVTRSAAPAPDPEVEEALRRLGYIE